MKVFLVRHARAGAGDPNGLLTLTDEGREQARRLADAFAGAGIERVLTSPSARCAETLEPLAERLGLDLERVDALGEGNSAATVCQLLRSIGDAPAALCSHGDVIPELLSQLAPCYASDPDRGRCSRASTWLLEGDLDGVLEASYRAPPAHLAS